MKTVTLNMIVIRVLQCSFVATNKYLERMLLLLNNVYGRGLKYPVRESICAARDAFLEFWDNWHLGYLVYSSVFKSARPASQQDHLKRA